LGREGLANSSEDKYVLTLLDSILGASASSRIFQEVREKRGLAYAIGSFASYLKDTGLFGIFAGTSPKFLEEVIQVSCSISEDMRKNGITPEEFTRAKEQLKGNLALSFESTSSRMIHLARTEFYHKRFISLEEIFNKIDSVTKEQIEELAGKMLVTSEWSACVLGNVDKDFDLKSLVK
jgi:predicted Zn-dependent peptidase